MPYIPKEDRPKFDKLIEEIVWNIERNGELAYVLYKIAKDMNVEPYTFDNLNDVSGVLSNVLAEYRRKILFPYEDKKIKENGDI